MADRNVERPSAEKEDLRVGSEVPHQGAQADEGGEAGARRAPRVGQVHAGDADAETVREEARGAAEARADVEHGHARCDGRASRQRLHGPEAAVVVLVPRPEILGLERSAARARARGLQHLRLVDRVTIVEVDHQVTHDTECTGRPP